LAVSEASAFFSDWDIASRLRSQCQLPFLLLRLSSCRVYNQPSVCLAGSSLVIFRNVC
jgi:hypothetical protein